MSKQRLRPMDPGMDQFLNSPQVLFAHAALNQQAAGNAPGITRTATGDKPFRLNGSQ